MERQIRVPTAPRSRSHFRNKALFGARALANCRMTSKPEVITVVDQQVAGLTVRLFRRFHLIMRRSALVSSPEMGTAKGTASGSFLNF